MKASRFNRIFQATDGTWLAFNGMTTALAEIEPDQLELVRAMLADPDGVPCHDAARRDLLEALVDGGFLIEDGEDELATIKADLVRDRFGSGHLYLTIAPTLSCNFACDYCYEENLKVSMSRPVEQALVDWVGEKLPRTEAMLVCWYGGEPLLPRSYETIQRLSEAFLEQTRSRGIGYAAHLITNGSLLTRERMARLVELGVEKVQITLDGPPEVHDRRRHTLGGKGTFWTIIERMKQCIDLVEVQVRVNVDRRNAASALEVAELLEREGLGQRARLYLAQVTVDGAACGNIVETCFSSREFAQTELEIYREAASRGLRLLRYPMRIKGAFCTAERLPGYVIAPNGNLFKCWHEVTMQPDRAIGSLLDGQQPFQRHNESTWLSWDAMEKSGCRSCEVLPMCHGGCPLEAMKHPERDHGACEHYRYHLEPLLELHHLHRDLAQGGPGGCRS
jgi:uncharacterized protein